MLRFLALCFVVVACDTPPPVKTGYDPFPTPKAVKAIDPDLPASGPYFKVAKCASDSDSQPIDLVVGDKPVICTTFGGARSKLAIRANPNAKLTLGAKQVTIPASGELDTIVEFGDAILALAIDDFVSSEIGAETPLTIPWKLEGAGKPLDGTLKFTVRFGQQSRMFRRWVRDVVDGKIDRPAFAPPQKNQRKTVLRVPSDDYSAMTVTDRRGKVADVDLVAVEREVKRTQQGTCDFNSTGKVTRARRFGVEVEVELFETAGGTSVEKKSFADPGGCPMFAMLAPSNPEVAVRVDVKVVMAWLEALAKKS
jgi:hypothetical protein